MVRCSRNCPSSAHSNQARAAGHRLETHRHLGLMAARAVGTFPRPGEREAVRRLDDAIDAARRELRAAGAPHDDAPRTAGSAVEPVHRGLVAVVRRPYRYAISCAARVDQRVDFVTLVRLERLDRLFHVS